MVGVHNHLFDHSIWVVAFDLPCPIVFDLPFLGSVQLSVIECQRSSFLHILVRMEGFIKPWEGQLHIFADDLLDFLKGLLLFLTPFSRDFLIREGRQGR
jgi:hypothetical protein